MKILPFLRRAKSQIKLSAPSVTPTAEPKRIQLEGDELRNMEFAIHRTVCPDGTRLMDYDAMQIALLIDLRAELKQLNQIMTKMEQNTRRTHRLVPAPVAKLNVRCEAIHR